MCTPGRPTPVYIDGGFDRPFLEDLVGLQLAENIRSMFGFSERMKDSPYGTSFIACIDDSYLHAAISSFWSLGVVFASLTAGLLFPGRRKASAWLLAGGSLLSVIVLTVETVRFFDRLPPKYDQMVSSSLPEQVVFNLIYQLAIPFLFGLAIALSISGLGKSAGFLFARMKAVG